MTRPEVLVVGGAGDMARVAVRVLRDLDPSVSFEIADRDAGRAALAAAALGASSCAIDVFDRTSLASLVPDRRLVINATGPLMRTGRPVIEACIAAGSPYIDFGDTYEAAIDAYALDEQARRAGVSVMICAGLVPGLGSLAACALARTLPHPDRVRITWISGPTPPAGPHDIPKAGRALVDHMLHETTGTCMILHNRHLAAVPAFRVPRRLTLPAPVGQTITYTIGHAEVATLPRAIPQVRDIEVYGGLTPSWLAAAFQGLGAAIDAGKLTHAEAADTIAALDVGGHPHHLRPLRHALAGVFRAIRRGELPPSALADLTHTAATGRFSRRHMTGALLIEVDGAGHRRLEYVVDQRNGGPSAMNEVTGAALAPIAHLTLTDIATQPGVHAPEEVLNPDTYFELLLQVDNPTLRQLAGSVIDFDPTSSSELGA